MARRNMVSEVLSEKCIYGGLLATRQEVYADLMSLTKARGEKPNHIFCDRLAWMPPKATQEQAAVLQSRGMTLKAFRASGK